MSTLSKKIELNYLTTQKAFILIGIFLILLLGAVISYFFLPKIAYVDAVAAVATYPDVINLPTTPSSVGIVKQATNRFIHTYGTDNLFVGKDSGNFTLTGSNNTAIGINTLKSLTSGSFNTAIGYNTLNANTTGYWNMALGRRVLNANTTGYANVGIGIDALYNNTSGSFNVAIGQDVLVANTTGVSNVGIGSLSLDYTTGSANTAVGNSASHRNTTGDSNVGVGAGALYNQETGDSNVAIGRSAGRGTALHTKSGGVFIGFNAGKNENTSNKLYIANSDTATPLIYGEFDNDIVRINGDLDVEGNVETWGWITGDITFQKDGKKLWRMFEDEEGLYIESLKTGKVYKFVLQEVEKK